MLNCNFIKTVLLSIVFLSFGISSLLNEEDNYSNHLELFIHEDIINNFLSAIGEISGGGKIGGVDYNWKVSNFFIVINDEKAEFFGTIRLESGQFDRKDLIIGNVTINYDENENLIYVKIDDVDIDIDISQIFNTIPKDIVNINVDLSQYFAEPFKIQAPQPKTTTYPVPMGQDSSKVIILSNTETKLVLVPN